MLQKTRPATVPDDARVQVSAAAQLASLGMALGESLVAADLAALIAHKRQAALCRAPSSAQSCAAAEDAGRTLDAHRRVCGGGLARKMLPLPGTAPSARACFAY
jgi:hypothetical protein